MPSVLRVEGGYPLQGTITVRGAKNFVPKAMVAALLGDGLSQLSNVPLIRDVDVVSDLLRLHGVEVNFDQTSGVMTLDPRNVKIASRSDIDSLGGASRIPILFCGPLLHQLGEAFIPELGGCNIGGRPIDFHLDTLRRFGAVVEKRPDGVRIRKPAEGLRGALIELPFPSVGATEQTLLTAVRVEGITILKGAAVEPEIMDLINVLQKMGAIISVDTDRTIRIEGVSTLHGYRHNALPDRIEAASWGAAALATRGDIYVRGAHQPDMTTFLNTYRKVGGAFDIDSEGIRFYHPGGELNSIALETAVHPGFMTDWQQPLIVALTQAEGVSTVHETVYENRLGFTQALNKMGADIVVHPEGFASPERRVARRTLEQAAVITGPTPLHGADVVVPDLRGGYSYVIAALAAEGTSHVRGVEIIRRGYEKFFDKLTALGADFDVVD